MGLHDSSSCDHKPSNRISYCVGENQRQQQQQTDRCMSVNSSQSDTASYQLPFSVPSPQGGDVPSPPPTDTTTSRPCVRPLRHPRSEGHGLDFAALCQLSAANDPIAGVTFEKFDCE